MSADRFRIIPTVFLFLRDGNKILLSRRANTGYQDGKYGVPAGHLEGGELAIDGLRREALEEAGITIAAEDLKFVHVTHRLSGALEQERVDFFFEASKWRGEVTNMEPDKCDDLRWFDIDNLPDDMIPHVRIVFEKSLNGERYSEYTVEP